MKNTSSESQSKKPVSPFAAMPWQALATKEQWMPAKAFIRLFTMVTARETDYYTLANLTNTTPDTIERYCRELIAEGVLEACAPPSDCACHRCGYDGSDGKADHSKFAHVRFLTSSLAEDLDTDKFKKLTARNLHTHMDHVPAVLTNRDAKSADNKASRLSFPILEDEFAYWHKHHEAHAEVDFWLFNIVKGENGEYLKEVLTSVGCTDAKSQHGTIIRAYTRAAMLHDADRPDKPVQTLVRWAQSAMTNRDLFEKYVKPALSFAHKNPAEGHDTIATRLGVQDTAIQNAKRAAYLAAQAAKKGEKAPVPITRLSAAERNRRYRERIKEKLAGVQASEAPVLPLSAPQPAQPAPTEPEPDYEALWEAEQAAREEQEAYERRESIETELDLENY